MPGGRVGHFRDAAAQARYAAAYRDALARLPQPDETYDVPTGFGTVRVYRFAGPPGRPVVLAPGRNAAAPMWGPNVPGLIARRTVYALDLIGEPGMSVQHKPIAGSGDQAQWFGEMLAALGLDRAHLMGASFGGWTVTNYAVRRPGAAASLTLLDPVLTFAPIPVTTMLMVAPMASPHVPAGFRAWVLGRLSGGAAVDESDPVTALITSGSRDYVLRQPLPARFTDTQLRALDIPVLAVLAGRSVIHDAARAAATARRLLPRGTVELWGDASHALTGEFVERIADRTQRFWGDVDT